MRGRIPVVGGHAEPRDDGGDVVLPAVLVRQRDKPRACRLRIRFATQDFANLGVRQHFGETVRAEQKFVVDTQFKTVRFYLHSGFRSTEDVGDDVPKSVHTRLGDVEPPRRTISATTV